MYSNNAIKNLALAVVGASALGLSACGSNPANISGLKSPAAQTVEANGSKTNLFPQKINYLYIEKQIRKQLEKHIPDLSVTLHKIDIWPMPQIMIYPPRPTSMFEFRADEKVVGFAGPVFTQWFKLHGTYNINTNKAVVTQRTLVSPAVAQ